MGKRKREDPEYIKKKIKKLEERLLNQEISRKSSSPRSMTPAMAPTTSRRSLSPSVPSMPVIETKEDDMEPDTEMEPATSGVYGPNFLLTNAISHCGYTTCHNWL